MELGSVSEPTFVTFRLPRTLDEQLLTRLADKYRTLRLMGLQLSPEAFSSTLAAESQYSDDIWKARLSNPQLETFICAIMPAELVNGTELDLTDSRLEWVGQTTLRGPISMKDFALPIESGQSVLHPDSEFSHDRWQFLALYILPTLRGKGLAVKLCREALQWLQASQLHGDEVLEITHVRTMIKADNKASLALFKKLGFVDIGACTLAEALVANGEAIPASWYADDPRRNTRSGRILNLFLQKDRMQMGSAQS